MLLNDLSVADSGFASRLDHRARELLAVAYLGNWLTQCEQKGTPYQGGNFKILIEVDSIRCLET
jgi:hypothetical protein